MIKAGFIVLLIFLGGCTTVSYYAQSISGHLGLIMQRDDIADILQDKSVDEKIKQKLQFVVDARKFASEELGLPRNGSYSTYVDTHQPYVVWNITAAPEFSLTPKKWCFLFVGCVGYRGYYAEQDALDFSRELEKQGLEVYVRGVTAYSTLGWFDDPVLNTFLQYPDVRLAGLIFHELTHQLLYIKNDTAFNESFATMIEIEGIKRWLKARPSTGSLAKYQAAKQRAKTFIRIVTQTNDQLRELYQSPLTDEQKRQKKNQIVVQLKAQYSQVKATWDGYAGYDKWFAGKLNNAQLASVAAYHDYVPAFQQLLANQQGDLAKFLIAAKALSELDSQQRKQKLKLLRLKAKTRQTSSF